MSFSLHSSTENLGGGRKSSSSGSNSSSSCSVSVKSLMGLISLNASARPLSRNQLKESRWMAIRSGSSRTSSRLAKEYRSREAGTEGKENSSRARGPRRLPLEPGHASAWKKAADGEQARARQ